MRKQSGVTLIELLLVLAIIGIISAIAIPSFLGQRHRARSIGDAQSNTQVLRMQLESIKADTGIYGAAGTYNWLATGGPDAAAMATFPAITIPASHMNFALVIAAGGITYQITVTDPTLAGSPETYQVDQTGTVLFIWN